MTDEAREVWLEQLCADLAHKTLGDLMDGCRRIRTDDEHRWFPGSGAILAACKSPWDPKPRRYQPIDPLPDADTPEHVKERLERARLKYPEAFRDHTARTFGEDSKPLEMTPELHEREKSLASERAEIMGRRLRDGGW